MTDVGDLILLPGMMCDARLFAPQIAVLQDSIRISVPLPVSKRGALGFAGVQAMPRIQLKARERSVFILTGYQSHPFLSMGPSLGRTTREEGGCLGPVKNTV